jgi:NitT/TauT family transport system substrate-binding protein
VIGPKDLPRLPPAIGIATTALMKKNPAQLRALLAGRAEAVRFMYKNPDETIKILSKVYEPLPAADVATLVKELLAARFWSEGEMEMELLTNTVKAMRYVGLIKTDPDLKAMIDLSFLPAGLQKK